MELQLKKRSLKMFKPHLSKKRGLVDLPFFDGYELLVLCNFSEKIGKEGELLTPQPGLDDAPSSGLTLPALGQPIAPHFVDWRHLNTVLLFIGWYARGFHEPGCRWGLLRSWCWDPNFGDWHLRKSLSPERRTRNSDVYPENQKK